jgi:diguanylate cyclase (GGDEF)-like protein
LFDIDYFKKINDTYGHLAGDYVLKEFAAVTQKLLRKYDYAARFGGEEFLIVLPETNETSAQIVAERFRRYIENQLFTYDDQIIKVTVSVGISVFDHSLGLDGSLLLADKALYYSKENGRNRVTLWTKDLE